MAKLKIAVIGAGSIAWSSKIIHDLLHTPTLFGSEVALVDIDARRLKLVEGFARRYASELGADYKFYSTADRREAVRDADFVVNTAMYGGHGYYEKMREVSERHGYYRGVNSTEWNMVSDYHTIWGYYQFKLALEVALDVEQYAPNAWLLQVANPVFELTTLISRETRVNVIGLCHGHLGYKEIARALGYDPEKVEFEAIGFNHVIWLTKLTYAGRNLYPLIDEWIERKAQEYWARWRLTQRDPFDIQMSPAAVDMYRRYGLFPVGDTVRGGTWMYHRDLKTKQQWFGPTGGPDSEVGWMVYLARHEWYSSLLEKIASDPGVPISSFFPQTRTDESLVPIINSIANDQPATYQVNVPNTGAIDGLPGDVAVEIPAEVSGKGVKRPQGLKLPGKILKAVLWPRMLRMEMALTAFLEGGRQILIDWLMLDPRTKSEKQAEEVWDAILSMPENEEMARHYRG
ncbi:alpha-glucosidase/alpha-galactosidase [Infirmifilum lucidum]|uniref:alpha-glucosidase/alpha-galactosidase n=1 Tax=Infirmifilum lucidum TaxID=2776706 RepID=UPI001CED2512|nr:alpha-glucosidase/alpha-galactosidase [Infirmifilum lucidum]